MKNHICLAALCCISLVGCSSNDNDESDVVSAEDTATVPVEIRGTWVSSCIAPDNGDTDHRIETLFFTDTDFDFVQENFIDATCTTVNVDNSGFSALGLGEIGDVVTTTSGVEARELDHIIDTFVNSDGSEDSLDITSINILLLQDDMLFLGQGGVLSDEERPDTIIFDVAYIRQ